MNQKTFPGIVLVAGLLACGVGFSALPMLQTSRDAARNQASVHVERARRLLHEFDHRFIRKAILLDQLSGAEVDVDIEDAEHLLESFADQYQLAHSDQWNLYPPKDYALPNPPRTAQASYGNLTRQIEDGIHARDAALADNDRLLAEAMESINAALSVQSGDVSGRSFSESNRLQGVIYYNHALCERIRAVSACKSAERQRQKLAAYSTRAKVLRRTIDEFQKDLSNTTDIAPEIADRRSELDEAISKLKRQEQEALTQAAALNARMSDATERANAARAKMESIKKEGVNFDDPNGGSEFAKALLHQDRLFRAADNEATALQFGHFPNAQIDRSGDLLRGSYVENGSTEDLTMQFGVVHFRELAESLAAKADDLTAILNQLRTDQGALAATRASDEATTHRLIRELLATTENAANGYQRLLELEAEAVELQDNALALLDKAKASFRQAATAATAWVQSGRTQAQSLAPEARQASAFTRRAESGWMAGHIAVQQADCDLAKAWILHSRYIASRELARLYAMAGEAITFDEAGLDAEASKSAEAHDAAVEAIQSAVSAIQKGHRDAGKHWTFVAQVGAANDLLALLGHPEYAADAIEAYRSATKGREAEPYTRAYVKRLAELEAG